ncbi:MAG: DMT family transporter [Pseudomonadota bacterium]
MSASNLGAKDNLRGSAFMLLAMASFAIGDGIIKLLGEAFPLSQIIVIRGSFAVIMLSALTYYLGDLRPLHTTFNKAFMLRLTGEIIATVTFLTALLNMPIANATAIMQALPLTVCMGAALFLNEQIGWRRLLAIMTGLIGVLLIVQPGTEGFTTYSIYCIIAIFAATLRDLATRRLDADLPATFVSLVTIVIITLLAMIWGLFEDWQSVDAVDLTLLAIASLFLMSGFLSIISAMRFGEVAFVTPFRYSVLLFSILIGIFIFEEVPNTLAIIGSVIVVTSGIYTFYREQFKRKQTTSAVR